MQTGWSAAVQLWMSGAVEKWITATMSALPRSGGIRCPQRQGCIHAAACELYYPSDGHVCACGPAEPACCRLTGRLGFGAMRDEKANLSSPSGSASPDPGANIWRVLARLTEAESLELLAHGGLGRLVYNSRYGPMALPVTYRIDAGSIVLGTWDPVLFDEDLRTGIAQADYQVAVEVDQIDVEAREGWFVLVRGAAHHLDTEAERAPFIDAGLEPWIEGVPAHFIRVNPTGIWGNRVRSA